MHNNTEWKLKQIPKQIEDIDINFDEDLLKLLYSRNLTTTEEIKKFLVPKLENLGDESGLKDIDIAYKRIKKAIDNDEKIMIYGDYDVDGITSTSILYLTLKKIGAKYVSYYIPIRDEGYGMNMNAIDTIKQENASVIITVDCGITSYNEVKYSNSLGIDVIITDHHSILNNTIPEALAVINPKRVENTYPFKELAGVGTIFMVLKYILKQYNLQMLIYDYLDLVALGTIADLVPLIDDNRIIVKYGLKKLINTNIQGLKYLVERLNLIEDGEISSGDVAFKLCPVFNAAGRLEDSKIVVKLLTTNNPKEIQYIVSELLLNNATRKQIQETITEQVIEEIEKRDIENEYILISHSPNYHHGVIGIVASRILELYNRPTIILDEKVDEGIAVASCRSISGFNITTALNSMKHLLVKYGGHSGAAGFTIKLENIEQFKKEMAVYTKQKLTKDSFKKIYEVDKILQINKISYEFIKMLDILKPFGMGNPTPTFITKNLILDKFDAIGKNKNHLHLYFSKKGFKIQKAIWFNPNIEMNSIKNDVIYDILYKLRINKYNNNYYTSVQIEDMKMADVRDDRLALYNSIYNTTFPLKSFFTKILPLNEDDEIGLKLVNKKGFIIHNNNIVGQLDENTTNLLKTLKEYYNFKFTIKIKNMDKYNNDLVHIEIYRDYNIKFYTSNDKVALKQIKKELLGSFEYNKIERRILNAIFREHKNVVIDINKIKIDNNNFNMRKEFFDNIILTLAIFHKYKTQEKLQYITNRKSLSKQMQEYLEIPSNISDIKDNTYFKYVVHIDENEEIDSIKNILQELENKDFNTENIIIIYTKKKSLTKILKNIAQTKYELIKEELKMNNIKHISEINNTKNLNYDKIFIASLPNKEKIQILETENDIEVFSDNSILEYLMEE